MKTLIVVASILTAALLTACGGDASKSSESTTSQEPSQETATTTEADPSSYDPKRGEGKFTAESLKLNDKLDVAMAKKGEDIAAVKCTSCHKTTDEKLVGPGWKGVTTRRAPEWILNFITNPDPMINKDPEAQAMLELCLVRMPNQNLNDEDARNILEYMRKNDGLK